VSRPSPPTLPHRSSNLSHLPRNGVKEKNVKINNRNKCLKKKIFKINTSVRCNQCQGYGHTAVEYTRPFKIVLFKRVPIVAHESESIISSEITLAIKKFNVVPRLP